MEYNSTILQTIPAITDEIIIGSSITIKYHLIPTRHFIILLKKFFKLVLFPSINKVIIASTKGSNASKKIKPIPGSV